MIKFIYLKNSNFFSGLSDAQISKISEISVVKKFEKKQILCLENQVVDGVYIVGSGSAKVYKTSDKGQSFILKIAGPGEAVGEVACLLQTPIFPANAEASEYSEFIFILRSKFLSLLSADIQICMHILSKLAGIIFSFSQKIGELAFSSVRDRILKILIDRANELNVYEFELDITKQTLASQAGTIPETVSRIFKSLENDRIIKVDGKKIKIL